MSYPVQRALAVLVMIAAVVGVLALRVGGAPDVESFRTAMAPAPDGGLYAALAARKFVQVGPDGTVRAQWQLPAGTPLSLAASGDNLLLGTNAGLYRSVNRGRTWTRSLDSGRFLAVGLRGDLGLAGAWAAGLWVSRDGGQTWTEAPTPDADTEFEAIALGDSTVVVATLLGGLVSSDQRSWTRTSLPGRLSAVDAGPTGFAAGDWRGGVFNSTDGRSWQAAGTVTGGIWGVSASSRLVATTQGLVRDGRTIAFAGREVTALEASGHSLYAAVALGPIYASTDGGESWALALQR